MKAKISFGNWLLKQFNKIEDKISKYPDKNYVNTAINEHVFDYVIIKDCNTSYDYCLKIKDGTIITEVLPMGFTINKDISVYDGDFISIDDLDVSLNYPNENKEKITNWDNIKISNLNEPITKENNKLVLTYMLDGNELFTTKININVKDFDPAVVLVDFYYIGNNDGIYTINGWKGTLNGESSTEMVFPNNAHIKV